MSEIPQKKKRKLLFRYSWVVFVFVVGIIIVKGDEVKAFIKNQLKSLLIDSPIIFLTDNSKESEFVKSSDGRACENRLTLAFECAEPLSWYKQTLAPSCGEYKSAKDIQPPSIESHYRGEFIYWFGYCNGTDRQLTAPYGKSNVLHDGESHNPSSDKLEILDCISDDDEINEGTGVPRVFPAKTRKYAAFGIVSRPKGQELFKDDDDLVKARNIVWTVNPTQNLPKVNATGANTYKICTRPMFRKK